MHVTNGEWQRGTTYSVNVASVNCKLVDSYVLLSNVIVYLYIYIYIYHPNYGSAEDVKCWRFFISIINYITRQEIYKSFEGRPFNNCCNGKGIIIVRLCLYPACNAYAQYRPLYSARLHNICPLYLINGMIFEKKLLNVKWMFWISLPEIFLIPRNNERDMIKSVYLS